jgi:hypothetical protein
MQIRGRRQTSGWPRAACNVPGCTRGTTKIEPSEGWISVEGSTPPWICGSHWKRIPRHMKRRLRRLERAYLKLCDPDRPLPPGGAEKGRQAMRLARENWKRMLAIFDDGHIDLDEIRRIIGP